MKKRIAVTTALILALTVPSAFSAGQYSPVFDKDGCATMLPTVDLGLTIDERIADGYYYSKTIRLLKKLLEEPELLEKPMNEAVEY